MYKKVIDILMDDDADLLAIAVQVAKSHPSVFVKAYESITDPRLQKVYPAFASSGSSAAADMANWNAFHSGNLKHFGDNLRCSQFVYKTIVNKYGHKVWLSELLSLVFGKMYERPERIKAIKLVRAEEGIGLKEAKWFVEDLMECKFDRITV